MASAVAATMLVAGCSSGGSGGDAVRLQRVVGAMTRFGLLPKGTTFQITSMIGS